MSGLTKQQDAFGQVMYDHHVGKSSPHVIEREDGLVDVIEGGDPYFARHEQWSASEKETIALARGKVLDIGCGAGRHALYLQSQGLNVTGIDNSPLAIKVCRLRGLRRARLMSITEVNGKLGCFDTIIMFGNRFGSFRRARWLLRRFAGITRPEARIIAQTRDPYDTREAAHLAYHRANRRRGRMSGQARIRVRYKLFATPWIDYLMVSRDEMKEIVVGTGWRIERLIDTSGPGYVAVLEKEPAS